MKPSIYSLTRQDLIDWIESKGEKNRNIIIKKKKENPHFTEVRSL